MSITQFELDFLADVAGRVVEIYGARQHRISTAQNVDRAFDRSEAESGLRAALHSEALELALGELKRRVETLPGGAKYIATQDGMSDRHFRVRSFERRHGEIMILSNTNRGLQAIGEGPDPAQSTLGEFEPWAWGFRFDGLDLAEIVIAHQLDVVPSGTQFASVFGERHQLHDIDTEPFGAFRGNSDDDPWGDDGIADASGDPA